MGLKSDREAWVRAVTLASVALTAVSCGSQAHTQADVSARRHAIREIAIVAQAPELSDIDLSVLGQGLRDSDGEVRRMAFATVVVVAMRGVSALRGGPSSPMPLTVLNQFTDELQAGLVDQDEQVRASSLNGLVLLSVFDATRVEHVLVQKYADRSPVVRRQAVARLSDLEGLSRAGLNTMVAALMDSDPGVQQQAAIGVGQHRPHGGIDGLAAALRRGGSITIIRASMVAALSAYGAAAKEHLPLLHELLAKEYDPATKTELDASSQGSVPFLNPEP